MRVPPGRTGRLWLRERITAAERGAEILDQKRHALEQAERDLAAQREDAARDWEVAARAADRALLRAVALGGERQIERVRTLPASSLSVSVSWRNVMGVAVAEDPRMHLDGEPRTTAVAASVDIGTAALAYREAVAAAARHGAARQAHEAVVAELAATARRQRVVEARLLPQLRQALKSLEHRLAEEEREGATQARWVRDRFGVAWEPRSGQRGLSGAVRRNGRSA